MSELRWALLVVGVVFFAALTIWELRRPRQARSGEPGAQTSRAPDSELELPEMHAREPLAGRYPPILELPEDPAVLPVLAPASEAVAAAGTAEASEPDASEPNAQEVEEPAVEEVSPQAAADEGEDEEEGAELAPAVEAASEFAMAGAASRELPELPEVPGSPAPLVEWPPDAERRVVALRLVATQPERFAGRSLRQALAAEGFVLGRFDIFHKGDEERRAVLSAASLNRPGTFDSDTMDSQHFGGLSLFAVLPGPMPPPQAFEELVTTARSLNNRLCGVLQDEAGLPLTPSRIATLRERLTGEAHS